MVEYIDSFMGFKYAIRDDSAYFLTHTVVGWIDIFTRRELVEIIISSLNFCSRNKGLEVYAWCLMPSHLHMIAKAKQGNSDNLSEIMRDFKKFTSNQIIKSINEIGESRREWLLPLLQTDYKAWQVWQEGMHPEGLYTEKFTRQKLDYIHNNQALLRKGKTANTLGNYAYNYTAGTNKVAGITNGGTAMMTYTYNTIGQMTQQVEAGVGTIKVTYNAYGLVKSVSDASNVLLTTYAYDDRGNKVSKTSYTSGTPSKVTYYVSDAGGTTLAIYEKALPSGAPVLLEVPVYGSGRVAVYKPASNTVFYEINDNLGNVRAVIGKRVPEVKLATYEAANLANEQQNFLRMDNAKRVQAILFDHTNGAANGYSERLNGSTNEKYGIARSLSVMPGDTVRLEVYGKYVDTNSANWTAALTTLMGQISANTAGVVIDGSNYANSTSSFPWTGLQSTTGSTGGPKAYLNWLIFDKNYTFITGGYTRMSATPKEQGQDIAHERMFSPDIVVSQPGYIYTYLSNEETTPVEVYFDDFKVTQIHSRYVAGADYYPYGLPMSDRQITQEPYRFGYQGQYSEKDQTTGWNEFDLRMYDARFGRWVSPDPKGQFVSPYLGMGNKPINGTDPDGGLFDDIFASTTGGTTVVKTSEKFDRLFVDGEYLGRFNQGFWKNIFSDAKVFDNYGKFFSETYGSALGNKEFFAHLYDRTWSADQRKGLFQAVTSSKDARALLPLATPFAFITGAELAVAMPAISSAASAISAEVNAISTYVYVKANAAITAAAGGIAVGVRREVQGMLRYHPGIQRLRFTSRFADGIAADLDKAAGNLKLLPSRGTPIVPLDPKSKWSLLGNLWKATPD